MVLKRIFFALFLGALAGGLKAATAAPAPALPRPVQGLRPVATAMPGIFKKYAPVATRTPEAGKVVDVATVSGQKDSVSVVVKGGMDTALGEFSKKYSAGFNGGLEFHYNASHDLGFAFYTEYNSIPYNLTTAAQPLTSYGFGLR